TLLMVVCSPLSFQGGWQKPPPSFHMVRPVMSPGGSPTPVPEQILLWPHLLDRLQRASSQIPPQRLPPKATSSSPMLPQMQDSVDKSGISIISIKNETELATFQVEERSKQLWGKPSLLIFPIYVVFHHGKPCGFFIAHLQMCIYPALHPEFMTAKEFLKVNRSLINEMKRMTGDPIFMLCEKFKSLGDKTMRTFRLKQAPEQAFIYDEEVK